MVTKLALGGHHGDGPQQPVWHVTDWCLVWDQVGQLCYSCYSTKQTPPAPGEWRWGSTDCSPHLPLKSATKVLENFLFSHRSDIWFWKLNWSREEESRQGVEEIWRVLWQLASLHQAPHMDQEGWEEVAQGQVRRFSPPPPNHSPPAHDPAWRSSPRCCASRRAAGLTRISFVWPGLKPNTILHLHHYSK